MMHKTRGTGHGSRAANRGLSLMEATLVMASVALLTALSLPAARTFFNSLATSGGTRVLISASLASARAIAAREQRYAGIRFQEDLNGNQYIIFIVQDPALGAYFFRAVENLEPLKLPQNIGAMDFTFIYGGDRRDTSDPVSPTARQYRIDDPAIPPAQKDSYILNPAILTDMTTFSIIFSPAGKLVIHGVRMRNRNGFVDTTTNSDISFDDVFNKKAQVDARFNGANLNSPVPGAGMFYQDDYWGDNAYPDLGIGPEPSRSSFIIYEKDQFTQADDSGRAWSDYLYTLVNEMIFINPYTGTIINSR